MFVRDGISGDVLATLDITDSSGEFKEYSLNFKVEKNATVQLGISHDGDVNEAVYIDDASVISDNSVNMYEIEGEYKEISKDELTVSANSSGVVFEDGKIISDSSSEYKIMYNGITELSEFEASVNIAFSRNEKVDAGLYVFASKVGNGQDDIDAYNVHIESAAKSNTYSLKIFRFANAYMGTVGKTVTLTAKSDVISLRVMVKNDTIFVFADGAEEPNIIYSVPEGTKGGVGLRSQNQASVFTDFKIKVKGSSTPEPTPTPTPTPDPEPSVTTGATDTTVDSTPTTSTPDTSVTGNVPNKGGNGKGTLAIILALVGAITVGGVITAVLISKKKSK